MLNGTLETVAGNDMGIFWHTVPTPADFVLKLQWLRWHDAANSGVYLSFQPRLEELQQHSLRRGRLRLRSTDR